MTLQRYLFSKHCVILYTVPKGLLFRAQYNRVFLPKRSYLFIHSVIVLSKQIMQIVTFCQLGINTSPLIFNNLKSLEQCYKTVSEYSAIYSLHI